MRRGMLVVAAILLMTSAALVAVAQEEAPPPVDRTDPAAVAKAYAEACMKGDVTAVLALLAPDDPLRGVASEIGAQMNEEMARAGFSVERYFLELLFLPTKMGFAVGETTAEELEDGEAQVTVKRTWPVEQKIVVGKAEDGTWYVKGPESITATTGADQPMMLSALTEEGGGGPSMHESEQRLRTLATAMDEYAKDHGNVLPLAAAWVDELEPYVLDPEAFRHPAEPELEYGYAMNVLADQVLLPDNWREREKLLILFEWRGGERNASALPDELQNMEPFWPDGTILVCDAAQNQWRLRPGVAFEDAQAAEEHERTCNGRLRALVRAARRFAGDNDGLLPAAESWQDDIAVYLLEEGGLDDAFSCPAAEELDYGYAINTEVAGMSARQLRNHGSIILFFESDLNVPNAAGDPKIDAAKVGRHTVRWQSGRMNHVAHLDGSTGYGRPGQPGGPDVAPEPQQ